MGEGSITSLAREGNEKLFKATIKKKKKRISGPIHIYQVPHDLTSSK